MGSTINREKKIKENEITFIAKIDEKLKSLKKKGGGGNNGQKKYVLGTNRRCGNCDDHDRNCHCR